MRTTETKTKEFQLGEAQIAAAEFKAHLEVACERIEIAGSIRRQRPWVRDIDLVVIPQGELIGKNHNGEPKLVPMPGQNRWFDLPRLIKDFGGKVYQRGNDIIFGEIPAGPDSIQIDVYRATEETWGTLLLIKTGPKELNIELAKRAQKLGMHLNPQIGIIEGGKCIASRTEKELLEALKLPFFEPRDRDQAAGAIARGEFAW